MDPGRFDRDGRWADPPTPWGDVDDRLDAAAMAERLRRGIEDLPAGQRQVVTLRDVEGLSSDEVCEVLGITDGNQRVLLHRGRSKLRRLLEEEVAR